MEQRDPRAQRGAGEPSASRRAARGRRMEQLGVKKMRHLSVLPLLVGLLLVLVWLKLPAYYSTTFVPHTGLMTSALSGVAIPADADPAQAEDVCLVYARLTWRELEPERGTYDFTSFEQRNHFDQWRQLGARVIVNFCMDVPGDAPHVDLPDWLYEATGSAGEAYEFDGRYGFSPDYASYALREAHREALEHIGDRYDGDGFVMAVEVGSVGHYGLWDMSGVEQPLPAASVMAAYAQDYRNVFESTPLTCAARYDAFEGMGIGCLNANAGDSEASWAWLNRNFYGGYDEVIRQEISAATPERTGGVWAAHIAEGTRLADMSTAEYENLLLVLKSGNASYLYGADLRGLGEDRLSSLNAALGYRLWIRKVQMPSEISANSRLRINVTWQNDGVCAMPVSWPVEVALYRNGEPVVRQITGVDTHALLPGTTSGYVTLNVPYGMEAGEYQVTLAVLDPDSGTPGIELPMACRKIDGHSVIGEIAVR